MTQPPLQPPGAPQPVKQVVQPTNPVSVSAGGPEGAPVRIEKGGSGGGFENNPDTEKHSESSNEKQETAKSEQRAKQIQQQIQTQKTPPKKEFKPKPKVPKVYGYKIPPQIGTNYKLIAKNKGKGSPKIGLTNLYTFLDRLLKVNKNRDY